MGSWSKGAAGLTPGQFAPVLGFYSAVGLRWWDPRVAPARWVVPAGLPGPSTWLLAWEAFRTVWAAEGNGFVDAMASWLFRCSPSSLEIQ